MSAQLSNEQWLAGLHTRPPDESTVTELSRALTRGLTRALAARADVDAANIEDFVQDAMIQVLYRLDSFRGDSQFTTWAISIAIRLALTKMRKRAWSERSLEDLGLEKDNPKTPRLEPDAEAVLDHQVLIRVLRNAIGQDLSPRQRTVVLAELAGMPSAVLADRLGTNPNAIYKLHHDARKKLRRSLEKAGYSAAEVSSLLATASKT